MKKFLLLWLLALGAAVPALAQTPAATAPSAEMRLGKQDTLRAVSSMFERRRKGGRTWSYAAVGGVLALVRVLVASNNPTTTGGGYVNTTNKVDAGAVALLAGVFVGVPVAIGVGKLARFSEKQEEVVRQAYLAGQPLPQRIGRRLRKSDFRHPF